MCVEVFDYAEYILNVFLHVNQSQYIFRKTSGIY